MLLKEKVKALESENEKIVEEVAKMVKDHVGALESIVKGRERGRRLAQRFRSVSFQQKKSMSLLLQLL